MKSGRGVIIAFFAILTLHGTHPPAARAADTMSERVRMTMEAAAGYESAIAGMREVAAFMARIGRVEDARRMRNAIADYETKAEALGKALARVAKAQADKKALETAKRDVEIMIEAQKTMTGKDFNDMNTRIISLKSKIIRLETRARKSAEAARAAIPWKYVLDAVLREIQAMQETLGIPASIPYPHGTITAGKSGPLIELYDPSRIFPFPAPERRLAVPRNETYPRLHIPPGEPDDVLRFMRPEGPTILPFDAEILGAPAIDAPTPSDILPFAPTHPNQWPPAPPDPGGKKPLPTKKRPPKNIPRR